MQKIFRILTRYVVFGLAVLSVLITCVKLIKCENDVGLKTYHVVEPNTQSVMTTETYSAEFLCVGKVMDSLQVEAYTGNGEKGYVSYSIQNEAKDMLLQDRVEVQSMEKEETSGLFIDVSRLDMIQGEFYSLTMDFSETTDLQVVLGNGTLSIRQYFQSAYKTLYILLLIVLLCLSLAWLFFAYKKCFDVKLFVITAMFVGVFTAFIMPPANRDDEYRHFIRSYEGAMKDIDMIQAPLNGNENGLIGTAVGVDEVMAEVPFQINQLRLMDSEYNYNGYGYMQEVNNTLCLDKLIATSKVRDRAERYRVSLAVTGYRSAIYYWPQIIAMKLFTFLGSDCVWLYYIARIGQVIACVLMEALAMKIAPQIKELIWLVAMIPNSVLLQASCNSDGLLIAEITLLVAVVVWMKEQKVDIISRKGIIGVLAYVTLSYHVTVMKLPYVLVCVGTLICLTKDNFKRALEFIKAYKKYVIPTMVCLVVAAIIVLVVSHFELVWHLIYRVVPPSHVNYILANKRYIVTLFEYKWVEMFKQLLSSMNGSNRIPYWFMAGAILLFSKKTQPVWKRIVIAAVFSAMIMVIVLVGYTMTPPDYGSIWGITFRYLMPFVSFGALCLPAGNENTEKVAVQFIPVCVFVMMSQTLMSWMIGWSL